MDEIALLVAFFNRTWLLYDAYLQRSALLQLRDDDGDIATLEDASYELIYNQPEKGAAKAYFASGTISLDEWGGRVAYQLNDAYSILKLGNANDTGDAYLSFGYDNSSSEPNPRLILPTRETITRNYLKSAYINPINNNGNDWIIKPIAMDTSLSSTYALEPNLPALIFQYYRSGNNSTQQLNYSPQDETWLIPPYLELDAEFIGILDSPLTYLGEIEQPQADNQDRDYYIFSIDEDSLEEWSVVLNGSHWNADLELELFRLSDGETVDSSNTDGSEEYLDLQGLEQGSYLLMVYGYEGSHSPYRISFLGPSTGLELEPDQDEDNNSLELAVGLGMISSLTERFELSIHDANDVDYYHFSVSGITTADAYIALSTGEGGGDLEIALLDHEGNIIDQSESSNETETINLGGLEAGSYKLKVWGFEGDTGNYSLAINAPPTSVNADRYESNNSIDQATNLGTIAGERLITDLNVHNNDDIDYYQFTLAPGSDWRHFISLSADRNAGDLDIELWHFDAHLNLEEVAIEDSTSAEEWISLENCKQGDYLLKVYGYESETGAYSLKFNTPQETHKTDRFETNNSPDKASRLELKNTRTTLESLTLHTPTDSDWYQFNFLGRAQQPDKIKLFSEFNGGAINLQLFDRTGQILLASGASTTDSSIINLDGFIPSDYLIKVSGTQTGEYSLVFDLPTALNQGSDTIKPDRFESNNTNDEAYDLRVINGERLFEQLTIHNASDQDFYRFSINGKADQSHFAAISFNHLEGDLDLYLTNAEKQEKIRLSEGVGDLETISLNGLAAGNYLLEVVGYEGAQGNYSLTVHAPSEPQLLKDRFEQNNTLSSATPLRINGGVLKLDDLSIHDSEDIDFYQFGVTADTVIAHSITANGSDNISIELFNQAGERIRSTKDHDRTNVNSKTLSLERLKAGESYTLAVSSATPTSYELDWRLPQLIDSAPGQIQIAKDDWTIMVYMTASDLDAFAFDDINEMEQAVAGFRQAANVVVFLDQSLVGEIPFYATGNNSQAPWHTAGYSVIQADTDRDTIASRFEILDERNSGDPQTLQDFIEWAAKNCPAQNYGLVMWDHGGGLSGVNFDNRDNRPADHIDIDELAGALSAVAQTGIQFELTAFDACLMGMTELAAALAPLTKTIIASQEIIDGPGYDYTTALKPLMRRGAAPARQEMAEAMINSYTDQYVGQQADGRSADTLAAIESSKMDSLLTALNRFTLAAGEINITERRVLNDLRDKTGYYTSREYKDLGGFLDAVANHTSLNNEFRTEAHLTRQALNNVILAKTPDARQSSGLSIYLPDTGQNPQRTYNADYSDFIGKTGWGSLLNGLPLTATQTTPLANERWPGLTSSTLRPFDLGVFSGHGHQLPVNSLQADDLKQYYTIRIAGPGSLGDAIRVTEGDGALLRLIKADGSTELRPAARSINLEGVAADTYILEVSAAAPVSRYRVTVDAPRATSLPNPSNNTAAKAQNLGLVASQLIVPGQGLNSEQSNFFTFGTPRLGFSQPYQVMISSDELQPLEVRLLSTEQPETPLHTATGTGTVLIPYEAQGAAESYILEVRGPGGQRQGASSLSLYFNILNPSLTILGQAKEGQSLTASLTGIPSKASVNYCWQKLVQESWIDLDQTRSTSLAIPMGLNWSGSTVRVVASVSENGSSRDVASTPVLIASGLDSAYAVTVTPNKSNHDEGARLNVVFTAPRTLTNTSKANLYWAIVPTDSEGTPITTSGLSVSDFTGRTTLTGNALLPRLSTRSTLSLSLAADKVSELSESFRIQLFADVERKQLLNQSAVITVNDSSNRRVATTARDTLTGVANHSDTFVLPNLISSRLGSPVAPSYDTIHNFEAIDKVRLNGQSPALETSLNNALTGLATISVVSLKAADLTTALNITTFPAHSARLLQLAGHSEGSYLVINNHQGGFNASTDALIYLKNYLPLGPV